MKRAENIKAKARHIYLTADAETDLKIVSKAQTEKSTSQIIQEGIKLVRQSLELQANEQN